jgi:exopolysaccharide production protein ExoY
VALGQASIEAYFHGNALPRRRSLKWLFLEWSERTLSAILLLLLSPMLLAVASAIYLLSRRTPLIAHRRVGQYGRPFWVLKFRTMWNRGTEAAQTRLGFVERIEAQFVPELKQERDRRITSPFAAFCRKSSIDELPQLWHVLRGEMALVGPRPLMAGELAAYYKSASAEVLQMRPGITGLWQIRGRSRLTYRQRKRLDLFMVRNWSLSLHAAILKATIPRVILGRDAW